MNNLPMNHQLAIINWKTFHEAGLNKKRRSHLIGYRWNRELNRYEECIYKGRKVGMLSTEHYILLNLLRKLPPSRGYDPDSAAYTNAVQNLLIAARGILSDMSPYHCVFGDTNLLKALILSAFNND